MNGRPVVILLAEDNQSHAKLAMRSLEEHNLANTIVHVSDREAALDYLLRRGEYADPDLSPRPDVVLLDLRLPKVDGLDVLKEIKTRKDLLSLPVVILTSSAAETDVAKAYELHANSYLVKPVEFTSYLKMMKDLGFYWLAWNRSPNPNT